MYNLIRCKINFSTSLFYFMLIGHIFCIYIFSEPVLKISEKLGKDEKDIIYIKLKNTQFEINKKRSFFVGEI